MIKPASLRSIATFVVLLAFFMDLLDATIVNIAIPSIQQDLGASYAAVQWLIAGYSLAFSLLLITGGRLGDIYGYKRMFLIGIAGFTIASAGAGLAPHIGLLISARIVQGGMAALMVPQILSTIQVLYPPQERGKVSAFYGALGGLASVAGPILGALLIKWNFLGSDWRMIFLVNLPVGALAFGAALVTLPRAKSPHPLKLDIPGAALAFIATFLLVFPLIQGRDLGWPTWTLVSMASSVPLLILFAFYTIHRDRRDGSALVVPSLFSRRSFVAGALINLVFFATMSGFFLLFTLFLQLGLGYSILKAGLSGIPFSLGIGATAGFAGTKLTPRFGRWIPTVGALIMVVGFTTLIWTVRHFGAGLTPWELILPLTLSGIGMGMVVSTIFQFVLADVPVKDAGSASGVTNAVGQLGGAIGIALFGMLFFDFLAHQAGISADGAIPALRDQLQAVQLNPAAQSMVIDNFRICFVDRARETDPSVTPPSCRLDTSPPPALAGPQAKAQIDHTNQTVGASISAAATKAKTDNFIEAFASILIYEIAGLLIMAVITLFLPAKVVTKPAGIE